MPTGCVKDLCVPEKLFLFLFLLSHFFLVTSLRAVRFLRLFVLTRKGRILCGANIADIASSPVPPQHLTCKLDGRYALCSALAEVQKVRQNESSRCSGLRWVSEHWKDDPWNILIHVAISCILNCSDSELSFNLPLGFGLANRPLLATRAQHQHMLQRRVIIDYTDTAEPICWRTLTPAVLYLTPTCGLLRVQHITHWQSEDFVLLLRLIKQVCNYIFSFLLKVKGDRSPAAIERWANITESLSLKLAASHITKSPSHCFSLFWHVSTMSNMDAIGCLLFLY